MLDGRTLFTAAIILYICALLWGRREQYKLWTALFVLFIAFIAFHAESIYDLNNYYAGMPAKAQQTIPEFFREMEWTEVGLSLWFYLCSKLRFMGFLPFLTVCAFYGIQLALILLLAKREETPRPFLILAVIFLLCTTKYYSVLAGVKNHMGFCIFAASLTLEFLFGVRPSACWFGYFFSITFHNSLWPMVVLRMLLGIYRRYPSKLFFIGVLAVAPFSSPIAAWLAQITGLEFLGELAEKAETYYEESRDGVLSISNLGTASLKIILIALLLIFAYRLCQQRHWPEGWRRYLDFTLMALLFTVGASGAPDLLVRFPEFLGLLAASIMLKALPEGKRQTLEVRTIKGNSCIRVHRLGWDITDYIYLLFILFSGMFFFFQFLGTWTLIGWQSPALLVGSIR